MFGSSLSSTRGGPLEGDTGDTAEQEAKEDVTRILEAEPTNDSDHREQLAILVASSKAKEMIGVSLTQDQVKKLSDKILSSTSKGMRFPSQQ